VSCRFVASDEPRVLSGRHDADCAGGECRGCQPCTEPHCRVCGRTHADGTCAECLAEARDDLSAIAVRCGALSAEVLHRGIHSEAMTLLGPAADPEAWGHMTASVKVGRLPADYLAHADGELHPLFVLGTWDMVWRAELEHDEAGALTLHGAVDYLDRQMTYMAGYEHSPFEDFARDLRRCLAHIERVLHDQRQGDRANVGCFECGGDLERRLTEGQGFEDFWTCRGCRRRYTQAEYNFALRAKLEDATTEKETA
jgi:hypothetical protein